MNPELVILQGEDLDKQNKIVHAINSLSDKDLERLCGDVFRSDDINYLKNEYPETMGVVVTAITSVIGAVGGLVSRIAKRIRARRNARRNQKNVDRSFDQRKREAEQQRMMVAVIQQNKEKKQKQIMLIGGVVGLALLSYLL